MGIVVLILGIAGPGRFGNKEMGQFNRSTVRQVDNLTKAFWRM